MRFSESKVKELMPQKSRAFSTLLLALLTSMLFFVPHIIKSAGIFNFFGEFGSYYTPYYQICHDAVRGGEWGWNNLTGLGTNFIASYAFGTLTSPFFWLTLPFPNSFIPYLAVPIFVLKFSFAAFTAYFYLRRFSRMGETARIGALLYAFSSFSVCGIYFSNFHEAIIMFPLLLLSLELLITENRRGLLALTVTLCAAINYLFFFAMLVFGIIYIVSRVSSGAVKLPFLRLIVLLFEVFLGVGMAAFLLYPAVYFFLMSSGFEIPLGWDGIINSVRQAGFKTVQSMLFPPDAPAKSVFVPNGGISLGAWLPLFSAVGVFTLFFTKRKHWIKRLFVVCLFIALVPILNNAFFAYNDKYFVSWYFMPMLIMCLATVIMIEDVGAEWNIAWKWVFAITLGIGLIVGLFPQIDDNGNTVYGLYNKGGAENPYTLRFWLGVAIAVVGLIVLRLLLSLIKSDRAAFLKSATACVCVLAVIYANVFIATSSISTSEKAFNIKIDLPQEDGYRVDVYDDAQNTAMYFKKPSVDTPYTMQNASVKEFYGAIGLEDEKDMALCSLLSVKYIINHSEGESFIDTKTGETAIKGFEYLSTSEDYYIYENKNYIPYGFSYKYYMSEEFFYNIEPEKRSTMLLKAMVLDDAQIEEYGDLLINIEDTDMYSYGSDVSLFSDYDTLSQDALNLKASAADKFVFTKNGFNATVTRTERSLVFFSIPFDKGWSATVDGVPVKVEKVNAGFMAIEVEAGISEIVFDYKTPFLKRGIIISIGCLAVFLFYMLLSFIYYRNRSDTTRYPEGDELIFNWHKEDMFINATKIEETQKQSILDDSVQIPHIENGFEGGFTIDTSFVDGNNPNEEKTE